MVPLVRMHAFETRLKRMLKSLDADGMLDPQTGLLTREAFWQDLAKAIAEALMTFINFWNLPSWIAHP